MTHWPAWDDRVPEAQLREVAPRLWIGTGEARDARLWGAIVAIGLDGPPPRRTRYRTWAAGDVGWDALDEIEALALSGARWGHVLVCAPSGSHEAQRVAYAVLRSAYDCTHDVALRRVALGPADVAPGILEYRTAATWVRRQAVRVAMGAPARVQSGRMGLSR